nr:EndoU domain-containing protein [Clostridium sp. ZBS4]
MTEEKNNIIVFPEQRVETPIIIDFPAEKQGEKDNIIFIEGVADPKLFKVSDSALNHSSVGDFTYNPKTGKVSKMKGGGHGQANIDFLDANGLKYEVVDTYPNGVRVGNVADHKVKAKRTGSNQSWFPESWTESDIVNAGEYVGNLKENINAVDGFISYGEVNGVRVGVIRTNGQISTVFPDATMQP